MNTEVEDHKQPELVVLPAARRTQRSLGVRILRNTVAVIVCLGIVAAVVISGVLPRMKAREVLQAENKDLTTRRVLVVHAKPAVSAQEIELPATIQAYTEAPIYARTSGYLTKWTADIGTRVKA